MDSKAFYDDLSNLYEIMFPLSSQRDRLAFLDRQLTERGHKTVLDCGSGTGRQAIDLALRGFDVTGADISEKMVALAKENARACGARVKWLQSDFASVAVRAKQTFDAVFCIGNSLPHVKDKEDLRSSLSGMIDALNNKGLLILHLRNYAKVLKSRERLLPTLNGSFDGSEYIFQRFIDFLPDGRIVFNILTLSKEEEKWKPHLRSTNQYPATWDELRELLDEAGMRNIVALGDFSGGSFDTEGENLIIMAVKDIQ